MKDQDFINAATKLKRMTGNDLSTVGMEYESRNVSINIYGDQDDDYQPVFDVSYKYKKKWHKAHLSEPQKKVLAILLKKEVHKVEDDHKLAKQIQEQHKQDSDDLLRFGHPGAIYAGE